jgi:hypothetical protein
MVRVIAWTSAESNDIPVGAASGLEVKDAEGPKFQLNEGERVCAPVA